MSKIKITKDVRNTLTTNMSDTVRKELSIILNKYKWKSIADVDWEAISQDVKLSEEFIAYFKDRVIWYLISTYQTLSEAFIEKFAKKVWWIEIATHQILSRDFVEKYRYRLDMLDLTGKKNFSLRMININRIYIADQVQKELEAILKKHAWDKMTIRRWLYISKYDDLSVDFIEKFQEQLDMNYLVRKGTIRFKA